MVPNIMYKFQIIFLKETLAIERKPNAPRLTKIVGQETANYN